MKSKSTSMKVAFVLAALTSLPASAVWPPPRAAGDELAVWQATAGAIAKDSEARPYKQWYAESDFAAQTFIALALVDPDKDEFCGLSSTEVKNVVIRLKSSSLEPVQLDSEIAEAAGYRIAHKKNPRFRYIAMSRVVFDPSRQKAWLSVELNGERGSIVRLDKVDGQWSRTSRCGGWYMPE